MGCTHSNKIPKSLRRTDFSSPKYAPTLSRVFREWEKAAAARRTTCDSLTPQLCTSAGVLVTYDYDSDDHVQEPEFFSRRLTQGTNSDVTDGHISPLALSVSGSPRGSLNPTMLAFLALDSGLTDLTRQLCLSDSKIIKDLDHYFQGARVSRRLTQETNSDVTDGYMSPLVLSVNGSPRESLNPTMWVSMSALLPLDSGLTDLTPQLCSSESKIFYDLDYYIQGTRVSRRLTQDSNSDVTDGYMSPLVLSVSGSPRESLNPTMSALLPLDIGLTDLTPQLGSLATESKTNNGKFGSQKRRAGKLELSRNTDFLKAIRLDNGKDHTEVWEI